MIKVNRRNIEDSENSNRHLDGLVDGMSDGAGASPGQRGVLHDYLHLDINSVKLQL